MKSVEAIRSARRAATIVAHPLRPRILAQARAPISASELARRLGQPRQRVNYHVRQLAREGFLEPVGQQRRRNMVEQQYVASAHAYVVSAEVLGEVAPQSEQEHDSSSAAHLVALCADAQAQVALLMESASAAGVRVRTTSLEIEIRFASAEERTEFTHDVLQAIKDLATRYASAQGRPFRLILGCYPATAPDSAIRQSAH